MCPVNIKITIFFFHIFYTLKSIYWFTDNIKIDTFIFDFQVKKVFFIKFVIRVQAYINWSKHLGFRYLSDSFI